MPSSDKEIANKARKGALYTVASPALIGAPVPRSNLTSRPEVINDNSDKPYSTIKQRKQPDLLAADEAAPTTFKAPDSWKTVIVAKGKDNSIAFSAYSKTIATKTSPQNSPAYLSEAEPANMIESIDSDGKPGILTVQSGGRSSAGIGAPSDLHQYLKLLNQKVRNNWIPPRGIDRVAVIEFRISKGGQISFDESTAS